MSGLRMAMKLHPPLRRGFRALSPWGLRQAQKRGYIEIPIWAIPPSFLGALEVWQAPARGAQKPKGLCRIAPAIYVEFPIADCSLGRGALLWQKAGKQPLIGALRT